MSERLTRESLLARLRVLGDERQSREQAAHWARQWLQRSDPVGDSVLLKMLVYLAAADLPGFTRPYQYGPADFALWETELCRGVPSLSPSPSYAPDV